MKCPMFGDDCPYCSMATTAREFTKIKKNTVTGMFDPAGMGTKIVILGEFCNNDGTKFVKDMHYCPRRWALYRGVVKIAETKPRPKKERTKAPNKPARTRTGKGKKVAKNAKKANIAKKAKSRTTRIAKTAKRPVQGKPRTARNVAQLKSSR